MSASLLESYSTLLSCWLVMCRIASVLVAIDFLYLAMSVVFLGTSEERIGPAVCIICTVVSALLGGLSSWSSSRRTPCSLKVSFATIAS